MGGPYSWTFTRAWAAWLEGQTIDPPTCLTVSQTRWLIKKGILVRADLYKKKPSPLPPAIETADAPPAAETAALTPTPEPAKIIRRRRKRKTKAREDEIE